MKPDEMEELLVFPHEIPVHESLFEKSPLWIAKLYLECFDSDARLARRVPRHILEALARRFLTVMNGDNKSLDEAFGGSVRRQRNRLQEMDRQYRVSWEMRRALEKVKKQSREERGKGTPFEIALERVAEKLELDVENVRRIHREAGSR